MTRFLMLLICVLPLSAFSQFNVGHRTITYNDPARNNRAIECEIYYPGVSDGENVDVMVGEFPVIVFGHGFTMQPTAYPNWKDEFVPEGYIIVFPATETGFSPSHDAFGLDLRFIATEMQAAGIDNTSPFYQHVFDRTAIMGHSMGGGSSFLAASAFAGVDCVIGLAPAETNPSAITAAAGVSAPTLILSGASDGVTPPNDHHVPIYNSVGSNCKYFVSIANGSHCRFASNPGLCTFGELIPGTLSAAEQQAVSYAVCRPWFEYFLKDECNSWNDFQTALTTESNLGTINSICANDAPIIVENGGTLESNNQGNYQWYLNGNEVNGATQQTYNYTSSGTYQVGTINVGNCPVLSNEIMVSVTGIAENSLRISGTSSNEVLVSSSCVLNELNIDWFDTAGRVLESQILNVSGNTFRVRKPSYQGLKLLRIQSENVSEVLKVY